VHLESEPLTEWPGDAVFDAFAEALFADKKLRGPAPAANTATRTIGLTTAIDAVSPADAFRTALTSFTAAAVKARIRAHIGEGMVELDRGDGLDRHELVSGGEVARRLGVSRERVRQLSEDPKRFPRPLAVVGRDRVWRWGDVAAWARANERRTKVPRRRLARTAHR
jgi:predicted DNA-binding transcriptional regulator AlpA